MVSFLLFVIAFAVAPVFMFWFSCFCLGAIALIILCHWVCSLLDKLKYPVVKRTRKHFLTIQHVNKIDMKERVRRARAEIDWSMK